MKKHSNTGASSAERWFECPGSVGLCATLPPREDTVYSVQGSAVHAALEDFYKKYESQDPDLTPPIPDDYLGFAYKEYEMVEEDVDSMRQCIEYVEAKRETGKFLFHSEVRFDLSSLHPGLYGTADFALMASDLSKLVVIDYKHGAGMPVEVVDNKQLKYYALGAIKHVCDKHKIDYLSVLGWGSVFKEVEIVVVQPRCRHKDGPVRTWTVSREELDRFAAELVEKAKATEAKNAPFKAGSHCKFCPALAVCRTVADYTFQLAQADFDGVSNPVNLKVPAPQTMNLADLAKVMRFEAVISDWLKAVATQAQHCLEHGQEVPGFKLVRKRGTRKWTDVEVAKETLEMVVQNPDDLYEKSFLSPAGVEKLIGKKKAKDILDSLVTVPETGVTIAPEHDPREAVAGSAVTDFAD